MYTVTISIIIMNRKEDILWTNSTYLSGMARRATLGTMANTVIFTRVKKPERLMPQHVATLLPA